MVVSTPLKNISQIGSSSQLYWGKIKNVPNHQPGGVWLLKIPIAPVAAIVLGEVSLKGIF
jgi:hypothetical protein